MAKKDWEGKEWWELLLWDRMESTFKKLPKELQDKIRVKKLTTL